MKKNNNTEKSIRGILMKIKTVSFVVGCVLLLGACAGSSLFSGAGREFEKGLAFFNSGSFEQAGPHFLKAIELDPEYGQAHLYLGRTYLNMGQWAKAIQPLRTAYDLSSIDTQKEALNFLMDAILGASTSEVKAGHFQNAIKYLQEGRNLDPRSLKVKSQLTDTLISFGGKLLAEKNLSLAIENYKQATDLMPNNLDAYMGLARAFLQKGEWLKAASYIHQAEKIDPNSGKVQDLLNQILKMQ